MNTEESSTRPAPRKVYTLVSQKSHPKGLSLDRNKGCILKGLGGKEKAGIDVILCQTRILLHDLLHCGAVSQESQDVFHSKSCALGDGFAYHYFWIDGDPFQ